MARAASTDLLKELIGTHIAVFTVGGNNEHRDEGLLEAYESHILRLQTATGTLYIPLHSVRLIEPLVQTNEAHS